MLSISNHSLNLTTSNPTKMMVSAKTNWLDWRSYLPRAISQTFLFKTGEGWSGSRGGGLGRRHGRGEPWSWEWSGEVRRKKERSPAAPGIKWVAPRRLARLSRARACGATHPPPQQLPARARPTWRLSRARACGRTQLGAWNLNWVAPRGLTRPKGLLFANLVRGGLFLINSIKKIKNKKIRRKMVSQAARQTKCRRLVGAATDKRTKKYET
jgi:hypothetical protein